MGVRYDADAKMDLTGHPSAVLFVGSGRLRHMHVRVSLHRRRSHPGSITSATDRAFPIYAVMPRFACFAFVAFSVFVAELALHRALRMGGTVGEARGDFRVHVS